MDYSRHLVLYSGGADSTYFIESEPTAHHLIHYRSDNHEKTLIAKANAIRFGKWLTVRSFDGDRPGHDGEINEIHALYDTAMALDASITAASFGMKGIVMCFNKDDIGIDFDSLAKIVHRAAPRFEIATPLRKIKAVNIREELKAKKVPYVSCMVSRECGVCPKCLRGR
jgi:hypothetical protein